MASPHPSVRVVEKLRVSPPPGSVAAGSVPLTSFDITWIYGDPVERLFFYPFPHPTPSFQSHLPNLKSSLSLTLQHFYPLAGTVRRTPNTDDGFQIYYTDGDAVAFIVAESDDDFNELSAGGKRDFARIQPLIPRLSAVDDDTKIPLLAIQVTVFSDIGVCIGVTINHSAGDGTSTIGFLKAWASACKSGGLATPPPPIFDRALIPQPPGLYSSQYNMMMDFRAHQLAASLGLDSPANSVAAIFTLGLPQIQWLKQRVVARTAEPVRCSTFIVSCAYVWVCLVRTRGFDSHKNTHLLCPMNIRGRLDPPVSPSYFGNCLAPCFVKANAGDLKGEDGVVVASTALGKAIEGVLNDGVMRDAERWGTKIKSILAEQPISVAGSPKFGVYDTDFGWGRPQSVEVPSIKKTGAVSLAEARGDGGGVEIGLVLEKHEIDKFENYFNSGLEMHQNEP